MVGSNRDLYVVKSSDDRLKLVVLNAVKRLDHLQIVWLRLILGDRCLYGSEMFLIADIDVV